MNVIYKASGSALAKDADIIAIKCLYYAQQLRDSGHRGMGKGEGGKTVTVTGQSYEHLARDMARDNDSLSIH